MTFKVHVAWNVLMCLIREFFRLAMKIFGFRPRRKHRGGNSREQILATASVSGTLLKGVLEVDPSRLWHLWFLGLIIISHGSTFRNPQSNLHPQTRWNRSEASMPIILPSSSASLCEIRTGRRGLPLTAAPHIWLRCQRPWNRLWPHLNSLHRRY